MQESVERAPETANCQTQTPTKKMKRSEKLMVSLKQENNIENLLKRR